MHDARACETARNQRKGREMSMRCLRHIEIFGVHMLTGIWLSRARGRQGVPGELICEDVAAA